MSIEEHIGRLERVSNSRLRGLVLPLAPFSIAFASPSLTGRPALSTGTAESAQSEGITP